ncbi:MAG: FtsX-like permease family protein, partial [Gammaproteobacteria bacterium]
VLLASALLFARSLRNLMTQDLGFRPQGVLVANVDFTRLNLPAERRLPFQQDLLARIRALPGVAAAANANRSPLSGSNWNDVVLDAKSGSRGVTWITYNSPSYFKTLHMPLLAGRDFNENDSTTAGKVAIVNVAFAKKYLGGMNAIGQRFRLWESPGQPEPFYTVVGIAGNSVYNDLHEKQPGPSAYYPAAQRKNPNSSDTLLIRIGGGPAAERAAMPGLVREVTNTIGEVSPEISVEFKVLRTQIRERLMPDELMATLCGFFGGLAVLLAALGLYGLLSYTVAQRTNEIGIRMALGAQRSRVVGMVLGEVGLLVGIGLALGAGLTLAAGSAAGSLLFGLKPRDPLTLALAIVGLAAIALVASLLPARRASQLDPMVALRYE